MKRTIISLSYLIACHGGSGAVVDGAAVSDVIADVVPSDAAPAPSGVTADFFGIHVNQLVSPWPSATTPFGGFRSLSSQIMWANLNTADGVFDWTKFDKWIGKAEAGGQDILYTVYATPPWASSNLGANGQAGSACGFDDNTKKDYIGPGICDAPSDVAADGTGTDQHFIAFVTALVTHACLVDVTNPASGSRCDGVHSGRIRYYEMWNEPNITTEWNGTNAEMLRMAKDLWTTVKAIDPTALVTTPASTATVVNPPNGNHWLDPYLQIGGGDYADIVAFHGYVLVNQPACPAPNCIDPEDVDHVISAVTTVATAHGQGAKPLFDTEGSWGGVQPGKPLPTDPDLQAAYVGRFYLLQLGRNVARFYWYAWDITSSGYFYDPTTQMMNTAATTAFQQVQDWAIGNTFTPCSASGTVWTCGLSGSNGYQALAVWDAAQPCVGGTCSQSPFVAPSQFVRARDLAGTAVAIPAGGAIEIGAKPLLLDNVAVN
jgi:polysaccharide biosynthesis protein PslG